MPPQPPANQGYCITECWLRLGVPSSTAHLFSFSLNQPLCRQSDQRVEPQQGWRCSRNRQFIPLPLRFYSQMRPPLFKGLFHPPTPHKPGEYFFGRVVPVCRKQRLRVELFVRITNQHPTNLHWRQPAVIPNRRLCANFYLTPPDAIPVVNLKFRPSRLWTHKHLIECWPTRTFDARASVLSWFSLRSRVIERRIQP